MLQFEKSVVDQIKKKDRLLITRFGIDWMGSSVSPRSSSARKIELVGMKGSLNFFTIFLPRKAVQEPERNREGMHVYVYNRCYGLFMFLFVYLSSSCRGSFRIEASLK